MDNSGIRDIITDGVYNKQWLMELAKLPDDINELESNLQALIQADKAGLSLQQIHDLFYKNVIFFTNQYRSFEPEIFNKIRIWRARKNVNEEVEDLTSYKTFSYPPFCTENGRCHLKEQPVFYGSITKATAIFEIKPSVGDIVFLSDWISFCERDIRGRFLLPGNIAETNRLYQLSQQQSTAIINMAGQYGLNKAPHLEMIGRFIGDYFVEEGHPYYLTSWLGNKILFDANNLDLFFYASALNKTGTLNVTVRPEFTDNFLKISRVYKIRIKSIIGSAINFNVLDAAENRNGSLIWRIPEEFDKNYLAD